MEALAPYPTLYAGEGMVCAVDHLAAGAGVAILRAGGSAADAAVAASAVLAVTTQHMCGMGGDLFALVSVPGAPPAALNASGRAGAGADPDRLRARGLTAVPERGEIAAVPVPGCVDGWLALHERYGQLPLADVLAPAARYASEGFPASPTLAGSYPSVADLPGAEDYRLAADRSGGRLRPGTVVRRPGVARALDAIAASGRKGFYGGEFGAGLLEVGAGEYVEDDLARPLAGWVEPLHASAWGHELWTIPPNSQGYLTLAGALIVAGFDLPEPGDGQWAHLLVEAARAAAFDRDDVLSEGADGWALLAPDRLAARQKAIDPERAGDWGGRTRDGGTIYLCAVDRDRMGVSLIQSNYMGWGSHLVVPGVNIFLQNRGSAFNLRSGHPAEYAAGRRPPHTLAPALVTTPAGELRAVVGTMGGDSQPQVLLQLLARLLVQGDGPGPALAAGRWRLGSGGSPSVLVEGQAPPSWGDVLARRGHTVERTDAFDHLFGHAHAILVDGDHLSGATDPRPRGGAAAAY